MAAAAIITFDGAAHVSADVTGATVGHTYILLCFDPDSTPDSQVAPSGSLTLDVTDVGGFTPAELPFAALVYDNTTKDVVAGTVFSVGSTAEFQFPATVLYDGGNTVTFEFFGEAGVNYFATISAFGGSFGNDSGTGADAMMTLTCVNGGAPFAGGFFAELGHDSGSPDFFNVDNKIRVFQQGVSGPGVPGNPTPRVETVVFTYNGSNEAVATITDPIVGHQYFFVAPNGTPAAGTAVASPLVLTISDIDAGALGSIPFSLVVWDQTSEANYVAVDVFHTGVTAPYGFDAVWGYDEATGDVSVTFLSQLGVDYLVVVSDIPGSVGSGTVTGDGAQKTITVNLAGAGIVGNFWGDLLNVSASPNPELTNRFFVLGEGGVGYPGNPSSPTVVGSFESPLWRYFLANLDGEGIVDLSKLAADRVVECVLNAPLSMTGTVPSDNPEVWLTDVTDGDPYVASGTRLLWGFRRESSTVPYYVPRAATLVQLIEDAAAQDDARTRFTGYDPWRYLFARPVCNADGSLPGKDGISFTATQASVVIATLLGNTIANQGHAYVDAGVTYIGTGFYTGVLETGAGMVIDINFPQGTSVGQAWQMVTDMNVCDIILEPIYDPFNRSNYLCQLNVYAQAGDIQDEQIFAWNAPGRSLVGLNRVEDMTQAANQIVYYTGQGGIYNRPSGPIATDAPSIARFGEYWAQQFYPGQKEPTVVQSLADRQLSLRKDGKETVTFKPAPERSPRPWQDYNLGDRCPVYAKKEGFRRALGRQFDGTTLDPQYQRIYGWTTNISDDALETIDPVLTSPGGFTA